MQARTIKVWRQFAQLHYGIEQAVGIIVDCCHQQILDLFTKFFVDAADHTAIEHADHRILQDHQVAGMRIRVIETVPKDHFQEHVGAAAGDVGEVVS